MGNRDPADFPFFEAIGKTFRISYPPGVARPRRMKRTQTLGAMLAGRNMSAQRRSRLATQWCAKPVNKLDTPVSQAPSAQPAALSQNTGTSSAGCPMNIDR